jgi:Ca2+-transporting ATPase
MISTTLTQIRHLPHSPTNAQKGSGVEEDRRSVEKKTKKGKKGREIDNIEGDDLQTTHQTELDQDPAINPAPFRFKPYQLIHMLDPKSIGTLISPYSRTRDKSRYRPIYQHPTRSLDGKFSKTQSRS